MPFCTQVGHTGPLRPSETGRPIPYIDQVALDFPELVIVCGHVGYPWTEEMVAVARKHENVYIDTSAYTIKRLPDELVRFMKTGTGQRKVLFGTNYPMIAHTHALAGLDELGLTDEARHDFLHGNAAARFRTRRTANNVNGAQALINTLVDGGVDVCFANPGTSEMHFVAALDTVPRMRGVLTLFEGVATGAADGYARIADRPAAVLLHLGPGLGNGLANLHNARRARVPMVVVVGDHATYHKKYDAPLESDIDALAGTVSGWVRRTVDSADVGPDTAEAIAASRSGSLISTLILPADASWSDGGQPAPVRPVPSVPAGRAGVESLEVLRSGEPTMMLIGGDATRGPGLAAAARIAEATGARWLCETFPTRLERGAGIPAVDRLAYFAEAVAAQLDGAKHLVLAGAKSPVSFFAYPSMPSDLVPAGCEVHVLAEYDGAADALAALADELAPGTDGSGGGRCRARSCRRAR